MFQQENDLSQFSKRNSFGRQRIDKTSRAPTVDDWQLY